MRSTPYDELTCRTMVRPRPVAGWRRPLRDPDCQLSSPIPSPLEAGFGSTHAFQPEIAVGAERLHSADDRRLWHADPCAACGTAPRRPRRTRAGLLYRGGLGGTRSRRDIFFLSRAMDEGLAVRAR